MDIISNKIELLQQVRLHFFQGLKKPGRNMKCPLVFANFLVKIASNSCFFVILDMNPKLLLVYTKHPDEKVLLQQQYSLRNQYFVVPSTETETLQGVVRSICFEYSRNSPSSLVEKLKEFAFSCMKMTFSLSLFRQIMQMLCKTEQTLKQFKHYFLQINNVISDDQEEESALPTELEQSAEQEKDYLFQVAERGELRITRLLDQDEIEIREPHPFNKTQTKVETVRTQETITRVFNPEERVLNQKLDIQEEFPNFFYSAQTNYNQNWWKAEKGHNDESKEISKFDKKGAHLISQKSITNLVIEEMKRDLNREIELGKEVKKHQDNQTYKFNKMMKGKLLTAKMKKKGRRS